MWTSRRVRVLEPPPGKEKTRTENQLDAGIWKGEPGVNFKESLASSGVGQHEDLLCSVPAELDDQRHGVVGV